MTLRSPHCWKHSVNPLNIRPDPLDRAIILRDATVPVADGQEERELEGGGAGAAEEGLPQLRLLGILAVGDIGDGHTALLSRRVAGMGDITIPRSCSFRFRFYRSFYQFQSL